MNSALTQTVMTEETSRPMPARRYRIEGQQALRLHVAQGDYLKIRSPDGIQGCEILALNRQGESEPGLLGPVPVAPARATLELLEEDGRASARLAHSLERWKIPGDCLQQAVVCTAADLPDMEIRKDGVLIIIAAGTRMQVDQQQPPTELTVELRCSRSEYNDLPEPLAEPVAEYRIANSTACVYEVKAGQWIQIIDVEGRQCSDLIAFDLAALREGREVTLDATATRSVQGLSLPQPGLYSRFLDASMQPMLQLVQDTVGRHDSFLLACTPKFYEDRGYFGHVSCTENFNRALAPYGIAPVPAGRPSTCSSIPVSTTAATSFPMSPGPGQGIMYCCGPSGIC